MTLWQQEHHSKYWPFFTTGFIFQIVQKWSGLCSWFIKATVALCVIVHYRVRWSDMMWNKGTITVITDSGCTLSLISATYCSWNQIRASLNALKISMFLEVNLQWVFCRHHMLNVLKMAVSVSVCHEVCIINHLCIFMPWVFFFVVFFFLSHTSVCNMCLCVGLVLCE